MRKLSIIAVLTTLLSFGFVWTLQAQFYKELRGTPDARKKNTHSGNQIRTTFYNYGFVGRLLTDPSDIGGEWPINSGHEYVGDISIMVGAEVVLPNGQIIRPVTVADGPRGSNEYNPNDPSDFWGWEPLPDFANPDSTVVAMSHAPKSWPPDWPDRRTDITDPGWAHQWNGFFGKDQFNADQESYWWMDDSRDREFILVNSPSIPFYPDSTDAGNNSKGGSRGGLALLTSVRGFQWSQALAQNTLFWLYEVSNIGTTDYNKAVFGMIVGTLIGGDGDSNDDNSRFDTNVDLTYSWDNDNVGAGGFSPVAMMGYAFLESPGNKVNGFDDDNDAQGTADVIDVSILMPKIIQTGDPVVVIDYQSPNFDRTVVNFPSDSLEIVLRNGTTIVFQPGDTLKENPFNNIDDNLNGLIDENTEISAAGKGSSYGGYDDGVDNNGNGLTDEENPHFGLKFKNYLSGIGTDNLMIDEGRNDGIDNDGDWDPTFDDVGLDGKPDTGDEGEGDGIPTSGFRIDPMTGESIDTGLPGEPNIDKTDIDESDQIGLTSFFFFQPSNVVRLPNDPQLWGTLRPGYFDLDTQTNVDGDFIYGTGYFPLRPQQTERISLAFFFTDWKGSLQTTLPDLIRTKQTVQQIYNSDYNFAKAPTLPSAGAIAGNNKVTLFWDSKSEDSFDRLAQAATGNPFDFEGYKIYRATYPIFDETGVVTNVFGSRVADVPIAQFDKVNEYSGFFPMVDQQLGTVFYLGDNTGLKHTFIDSTAKNGFNYFYAVTAYDHGVLQGEETLFPAETAKFAAVSAGGQIELGQNVVQVRPEARPLGYVGPSTTEAEHIAGDGTGNIFVEPIDPTVIKDNHTYEISFTDSIFPILNRKTTSFTVVDVTDGANDIIVKDNPKIDVDANVFQGIKLHILNDRTRVLSTQVHWSDTTRNILLPQTWEVLSYGLNQGKLYPANYQIEIYNVQEGDTNGGISLINFPAPPKNPTNFKIKNVSENRYIKFNFYDLPPENAPGGAGILDEGDWVILGEYDEGSNKYQPTYNVVMLVDANAEIPQPGDILSLPVSKPFLSYDRFQFTTVGTRIDNNIAKTGLDSIKVVPNPYVATAIWEPRNTYETGRGERSIHFIHLPKEFTIRIYNLRGELVDIIRHSDPDQNPTITNGTAYWDLLSKDNLEISYGVYIYHVEAPGVGEKIGKFAVIK